MTAFLYVIAALVFLPFWLFIRGKSAKRALTISPEDIYTEIGSLKGKIPWSRIANVRKLSPNRRWYETVDFFAGSIRFPAHYLSFSSY
jgi:hypothetical protein